MGAAPGGEAIGRQGVCLFLSERHGLDQIDRFAGLVGRVGRPGFQHIKSLTRTSAIRAAGARRFRSKVVLPTFARSAWL